MERHLIALALERALADRPGDFSTSGHGGLVYRLNDAKTGHQWWVANDEYGFRLYEPAEVRFGYFDRRRAWKAYQCWLRNVGDGEGHRRIFRDIDLANEAARVAA